VGAMGVSDYKDIRMQAAQSNYHLPAGAPSSQRYHYGKPLKHRANLIRWRHCAEEIMSVRAAA
jgi:hypothetical protein